MHRNRKTVDWAEFVSPTAKLWLYRWRAFQRPWFKMRVSERWREDSSKKNSTWTTKSTQSCFIQYTTRRQKPKLVLPEFLIHAPPQKHRNIVPPGEYSILPSVFRLGIIPRSTSISRSRTSRSPQRSVPESSRRSGTSARPPACTSELWASPHPPKTQASSPGSRLLLPNIVRNYSLPDTRTMKKATDQSDKEGSGSRELDSFQSVRTNLWSPRRSHQMNGPFPCQPLKLLRNLMGAEAAGTEWGRREEMSQACGVNVERSINRGGRRRFPRVMAWRAP